MLRFFLLIISTQLLFNYSLKAQDFWEIVPTPDTANPWTITVHNNGDIWSGSNGIYLSQDNGESWLYKGLNGNVIETIEIDTLENIFVGGSSRIRKSIDYGNSWYIVNNTYGNIGSIIAGTNGFMLAGGGHIEGYLLRSLDYGETWDTIFIFPGWYENITQIVKSSTNIYYISTYAPGGSGGGVYKSIDQGETVEFIGLYNSYVFDIALAPDDKLYAAVYGHHYTGIGGCYVYDEENSDWLFLTQVLQASGIVINSIGDIYLGVSNAVGGPGGVYRSQDIGQTWHRINEGLSVNSIESIYISQDDYVLPLTYASHKLHRSINPTVSVHNYCFQLFSIKPFPNPFKAYFSIPIKLEKDYCELIIFDIGGRVVMKKNINQNKSNSPLIINGEGWQSGIYLYQIEMKNRIITGKIIKC